MWVVSVILLDFETGLSRLHLPWIHILKQCTTRSPSSALLPSFGGGFPC